MKVIIHRGLREIGGNIVEISSDSTRLIVDAGIELEEGKNPIDFQSMINSGTKNAIIISHYHSDHIGLLNGINNLPPVYMGERAYKIYRNTQEYTGSIVPFQPIGYLKNGESFYVGDIKITPYLADHSAMDAYSVLFECNGKSVFYTGDFRSNGRKSYFRYLQNIPSKVDVLICEGTTLSRTEKRNVSEKNLEKIMYKEIAECANQVFMLCSAMNGDRIVTAYKAAKKAGRIFLQDTYMSRITKECIDISVPNPITFSDVYMFTAKQVSNDQYKQIREDFSDKFVGKGYIASKKFLMCIRNNRYMLNYIKNLNRKSSLNGSVLIYSMWEGYKQQPSMKSFIEELSQMGIKCCSVHTSGHADAEDIRKLIRVVNPDVIIPIHTESEEWFIKAYPNKIHTNTIYEVK